MQCVALRQCSRATLFEVSLVDKIPKIMRSTNYTAPSPRTVSSAAQEALQNLPNSVGPEDLAAHRAMCERVQSELGAIQLERHQVKMHLDSIAGVPVRIFTPSQMPSNN